MKTKTGKISNRYKTHTCLCRGRGARRFASSFFQSGGGDNGLSQAQPTVSRRNLGVREDAEAFRNEQPFRFAGKINILEAAAAQANGGQPGPLTQQPSDASQRGPITVGPPGG